MKLKRIELIEEKKDIQCNQRFKKFTQYDRISFNLFVMKRSILDFKEEWYSPLMKLAGRTNEQTLRKITKHKVHYELDLHKEVSAFAQFHRVINLLVNLPANWEEFQIWVA